MPDNFKKEENGVNIGNADSPKKDIYFTNQDYSGVKTDKKACCKSCVKSQRQKGRCCVNLLLFHYCYCRFHGYFRLCDFLLK